MKQINYLLYYLVKIIILYLFYLMYEFVINGSLFGQICYVLMFVIYYFFRDINLEYKLGVVSIADKNLKTSLITAFINLVLNAILLVFIIKGYIDIVFIIFIVDYLSKMIFNRSLLEIILLDNEHMGVSHEN